MKNIVNYISPQTPYLAKFWLSSYGPKCSYPIRLQDVLIVISQERSEIKMIFFQVDKHESFLQVDFVGFNEGDEACPQYPK